MPLPKGTGIHYENGPMFSHVVIFYTDPAQPDAIGQLIDGANEYLRDIPGVHAFHIGRMFPSEREVVDKSYQVALNTQFETKEAQDEYQVHPRHIEFVEKVFKKVCQKVIVYDFK